MLETPIGKDGMPERGIWQITMLGREFFKKVAIASLTWASDEERGLLGIDQWKRFSPEFIALLQEEGRKFKADAPCVLIEPTTEEQKT
jgi:hypothetical protein